MREELKRAVGEVKPWFEAVAQPIMDCFETSMHFPDSPASHSIGQGIEEMIQPSAEKNLSIGGGLIFLSLN